MDMLNTPRTNIAGTILSGERDSSLPLIAGLLVALVLHVALIGGVETVQRAGLFSLSRSLRPGEKDDAASAARERPAVLSKRAANPQDDPEEEATRLAAALAEPAKLPAKKAVTRELPEQDRIRFGKDEGDPLSIAWIGYDDFQDMVAMKSRTEQPALQKDADPIAGAPLRPDPTAARPVIAATPAVRGSPGAAPLAAVPARPVEAQAQARASAKPQAEVRARVEAQAEKRIEGIARADTKSDPAAPGKVKPATPETERLAMVMPRLPVTPEMPPTVTTRPAPPAEKPGEADTPNVKAAAPTPPATQPSGTPTAAPATAATPSVPGSTGASGTPGIVTGAPRSDSESAPVSINGGAAIDVRPGRVVAGEGIEIKTMHPRFSAVALSSSIPRNPLVRVVFNKEGTVVQAEVLRSSGYANIDGPILASLYKWKASGRKLEQLNRSFEVNINIILLSEDSE